MKRNANYKSDETLVTEEIAIKLKKLGFFYNTTYFYHNPLSKNSRIDTFCSYPSNIEDNYNGMKTTVIYAAPTIGLAQKWFIDELNIIPLVYYNDDKKSFYFKILYEKNNFNYSSTFTYDNYDEALMFALKICADYISLVDKEDSIENQTNKQIVNMLILTENYKKHIDEIDNK